MARKGIAAPRGAAAAAGVSVHALDDVPWREIGRKGVREKAVRREAKSGQYLGLIAFDPLTRTGLHRHLGTALSYFLAGSLSDYQGAASQGMAGMNLAGATHDAISYAGCLLAARLEGPVEVPDAGAAAHPIHGGAVAGALRNPAPERWPDLNVPVEPLPAVPLPFAGIARRMIFDYAGTGDVRRFVALTIMPRAPAIELRHTGLTDWFVLGGEVRIGRNRAGAGAFVVIEPGARAEIASEYGANLLCWAEGPASGEAGRGTAELYGF